MAGREAQVPRGLFHKLGHEIDSWIGVVAAVKRSLYQAVVVKREQSLKAKLSIYQSICVPTYGHELLVTTERMRLWVQVTEMSSLWCLG